MENGMKRLLKLEEFGQFLLAIVLFVQMNYPWWFFPACLLLPDLSMIGYLLNDRVGAWTYNFFHHKLVAVIIMGSGYWSGIPVISLIGVILLAHSSMDRIFGYGLKFKDSFNNTHLGKIGKEEYQKEVV